MHRRALGPLAGSIALVVALADDASSDSSATSEPSTGSVDTTAPDDTTAPEDTVVDMTLVPATTVPVPEVALPSATPTELVVTELEPGEGPPAAAGDSVFVHYVGVRSEDGAEFDSNYGGQPFPVVLGAGGVIEGWDQGLVGATAGARLQLDIPADLAYGDAPPNTDVIQPGDALSFVIDVLAVVPPADAADAPTAEEFPLSEELVTEAVSEDLVVGDGATLETGQTGVFQLIAARGDTGEVLESTWTSGQPQAFVIAEGQLLEGLVEGLPGMQVGGRRAITIPSDPNMGLTPETNVVIIADLLATF